jgi:asparagine synthase (glutamine-hydrolysing)
MLALHLTRDAANGVWRKSGHGFAVGGGIVEPIEHPALESFAVATVDELLVVVRERCATAPPSQFSHLSLSDAAAAVAPVSADRLEALETGAIEWPLQSTVMRVSRVADGTAATIRGGRWGTAPLFLAASRGELWAHWDPSALIGRLDDRSLDWERVAYFLATFDAPYSRRTLLRHMHVLTERSTAVWRSSAGGNHGLRIDYPEPIRRAQPRTLKAGADVESAFLDIIASSTRRWLGSGVLAMSELSGGLDSALVSCGAGRLTGQGWSTCGLILPAAHRLDQIERRRELIQVFGFVDRTVDLADALPLQRGGRCSAEGACLMPWEEIYYEAMEALLRRVSSVGCNLLFTGFGGDELCTMNRGEIGSEPAATNGPSDNAMPSFMTIRARDAAAEAHRSLDRAPSGYAAASAVESAAFSSAMYLRQGIWPVHPLCTPELVRFCAALPADWRADRTVERRALARAGCSPRITHGTCDNFAPALAHSLRTGVRPMLETLFRDSRLADAGYLDDALLLRDFSAWADRTDDADGGVSFYAVAVIELMLRSLDGAPRHGPAT